MTERVDNLAFRVYDINEDERLLTAPEVCELLQIKRSYLYFLTSQKKLPHIKMLGHLRFRLSDIRDWVRSQEVRIGSKET
jgi:excisionase family DNA binding protein